MKNSLAAYSRRQLLYSILLSMLILSLMIIPVESLTMNNGHPYTSKYTALIVEINLSEIGVNPISSSIIVTVLNGSREVELPYIVEPVANSYTSSGSRNFIEHGNSSSKILVFISNNISPSSTEEPKNWYLYALRNNMSRRAVYVYFNYLICVYYSNGSHTYIDRFIDLPVYLKSTALHVKMIDNNTNETTSYYLDTDLVLQEEVRGIAQLERIEKYPEPNRYVALMDRFAPLWFPAPWFSRLSHELPNASTSCIHYTFTEKNSFGFSDEFRISGNVTRYELWIWLSSNKRVDGVIKLSLDQRLIQWSLSLVPREQYGYAVIVYRDPDGPGKYLVSKSIPVNITISISDKSASISFRSIVLVKAYVYRKPYGRDGVYLAKRLITGISRLYESNSKPDPMGSWYDIVVDGEAILGISGPDNMVLYNSYPYIDIEVTSSPDQRYDRVVDVYINGLLLAEKIARIPGGSNGTVGRRTCYFRIGGDHLARAILSTYRSGLTTNIRIVIRGAQGRGRDEGPGEEWLVRGTIYHYSRAPCLSLLERGNEMVYDVEPGSEYIGRRCFNRWFLTSSIESGVGASGKFRDVLVTGLNIIAGAPLAGFPNFVHIDIEFWQFNNFIRDSGSNAFGYITRLYLDVEIHVPVKVDPTIIVGVPSNDIKELVDNSSIWFITIADVFAGLLSFASINNGFSGRAILCSALTHPVSYMYDRIEFYNAPFNMRNIRIHVVYDPGWSRNPEYHVGLVVDAEPLNRSWMIGDRITVFYSYRAWADYWNTMGSIWHHRCVEYSDHGYVFIYAIPPG